ncbi:MAG: aldehyde dehydrogenase family protein [Chloroflexi bacterium]|nr:aldehyde dehydrogenase family protein [Chloroflexota bacterium]
MPDLAESWVVSPDGKTVTFTLASGVLWHDGQPFTSADVAFTFQDILLKYHSRTRAGLEHVLEGIDAPDPQTVVMRFTSAYGPLLQRLDVVEAAILPRHIYQGSDPEHTDANLHPVGTGPYRLAEYRSGDMVRLVRNERYFKPGLPYLDELVYIIVADTATGVWAFERGDVDLLTSTPPTEMARLQAGGKAVVKTAGFGDGNSNCQETMFFNLRRPILQRREVRQAIVHAVDQQRILDEVRFGLGKVGSSPISSALAWAHHPHVRRYPHDPAQAERLLDDAGCRRGTDGVRFSLGMPSLAVLEKLHEAIRRDLAAVGIAVQIRPMEFNAALDTLFIKREFDVSIWGYCNGPDPEVGVTRAHVTSNIKPIPFANVAAYANPRVDALLERAASLIDRTERAAVYARIQEEIFGPVLSVIEFTDVDEAVHIANGTCYGLGASVWTRDIQRAIQLAKSIESGQVYVNQYGSAGVIGAPFGGYKNSGFGRTNCADTILEYTQIKAVVFNAGQ